MRGDYGTEARLTNATQKAIVGCITKVNNPLGFRGGFFA
jgi:hypothetical protein